MVRSLVSSPSSQTYEIHIEMDSRLIMGDMMSMWRLKTSNLRGNTVGLMNADLTVSKGP